jgi:hypothetical protein
MVVTFNSLPPGVAVESDERKARKQMERHIKKAADVTHDRIWLVDLNLRDKTYTFRVEKAKN